MSPFFTVILPGYQSAPYLQKALDSIANQTFRDFEVICYVEESTDRSLEICQAMAERDSRFKVATGPKSGGAGVSRNYGIDHASGEYVVFVDSDDWILPNMLEVLGNKLKKTDPLDVLSFDVVSIEGDDVDLEQAKRFTNFSVSDTEGIFSGPDAIRRAGRHNGGSFHAFSVISIYRVAFLRKYRLYQKRGIFEDFEWVPRVWFYAERMAYINEVFYVYRRRPLSLTTELSSRAIYDIVGQLRSLMTFAADNPVPEDILSIWSNQWVSALFWFMFHPISSRKIIDADRKQALFILFEGNGKARFLQILAKASYPKRIARPLIQLAAKEILFPAKFYFQRIYYPLIEHRNKR